MDVWGGPRVLRPTSESKGEERCKSQNSSTMPLLQSSAVWRQYTFLCYWHAIDWKVLLRTTELQKLPVSSLLLHQSDPPAIIWKKPATLSHTRGSQTYLWKTGAEMGGMWEVGEDDLRSQSQKRWCLNKVSQANCVPFLHSNFQWLHKPKKTKSRTLSKSYHIGIWPTILFKPYHFNYPISLFLCLVTLLHNAPGSFCTWT